MVSHALRVDLFSPCISRTAPVLHGSSPFYLNRLSYLKAAPSNAGQEEGQMMRVAADGRGIVITTCPVSAEALRTSYLSSDVPEDTTVCINER